MTNENKKDDGGVYNTLEQSCGKNGGMSLRDYFAGQALFHQYSQGDNPDKSAEWAYTLADAMLEARKK